LEVKKSHNFICVTCGTQYPRSTVPPKKCRICTEERQYVAWEGQKWTTMNELQKAGLGNSLAVMERDLYEIVTKPSFAIGQRAFLIRTKAGNVLWDCLSYLDQKTIRAVRRLGGIRSIAMSHPHYYSSMVDWSEAFDDAPIYISERDREWVSRGSRNIRFWAGGKLDLFAGLQLARLGGHFGGSCVLFWPAGSEGAGVILSGDTIAVAADRRWVSFMYSYPNLIPLSARRVGRIAREVASYRFDRIYAAFEGEEIKTGARLAVTRSAERYISHLRAP
jgi:glyoxylase-like metal-dependent hydrolase (beta-lactamase superfamily II)